MKQSDTPRTDAESEHVPGCGVAEGTHRGPCDCADHQLVSADFARTLERELSAAQERTKELEGALEGAASLCDSISNNYPRKDIGWDSGYRHGAERCANEIRAALKGES